MIRRTLRAAAIASFALAAAAPASAEYTAEQLKAMLLQHGNKFEIDKDGDYKIVIQWEKEKRSQLVFLAKRTEAVRGIVIHEVFAPVADIRKKPLSGAQALDLLRDAATNKIGGWQIDGSMLYFTIMLIEPFTAEELNMAIDTAAELADNYEIKLTGKKDEY